MSRRLPLIVLACLAFGSALCAEDSPSGLVERRLSAIVGSPQVTVVHFWAPWCPNCRNELSNAGWSGMIAANPNVHFVFVTVWNAADGSDVLAKFGVGGEPNFQLLLHPNTSRKREDKVTAVLGLPLTWIPTTWVFRDGRMRYALNYGELRFPVLQQMIADTTGKW